MCDWVQLYARRHEDTWLYAVVCEVALQTERVLLAGRFLDDNVKHAIKVDISKWGE